MTFAELMERTYRLGAASAGHVSENAGAQEMNLRDLANSFLAKADEDWTFIDPEDVKRLARAVLDKKAI